MAVSLAKIPTMSSVLAKPLGSHTVEDLKVFYAGLSDVISHASLVTRIAELASTDPKAAKKLLLTSPRPFGSDAVFEALLMQIIQYQVAFSNDVPFEQAIQDKFFNDLETYLPGAIRAIVPRNRNLIPDGFVSLHGEIMPVEVKRHRFTEKSLNQLLSYLEAYGANRGVAVAPELTCVLPDNIIFVQVQP